MSPKIESSDAGREGGRPMGRWKLVLLVESVALAIAMIMPVTPSRTGSEWSVAELVFADPSYGEEVVAYLLAANLLILVMGAVVFAALRLREEGDG